MNPRVWCFDLEMNKPSNKIIQIGGVIGDLLKGRILTTFNYYINPHEPLDPFIIKLTGITQQMSDNGLELGPIKGEIDQLLKQYKVCKSPIVWGNGDLRTLKSQGGTGYFQDINREIDIKTVFQLMSLSKGLSMRGGLEKSLTKCGLYFEGTPHNALDDAVNTFKFACKMREMLEKCQIS